MRASQKKIFGWTNGLGFVLLAVSVGGAYRAIRSLFVRSGAREVIEVMKPGGGYIASPCHDYLLPETPVENVLALYETVQKYGMYS